MELNGIEHSTEPEDLISYGFDASGLEGAATAVVWPRSAEEVIRAVKYAGENAMAVVPRGAGTGLTGGSVPSGGAMVMSFEKMASILHADVENLNVLVEPGVINGRLQRELEGRGFFYPPDPSSMDFCTIGGNVAENAGGPRALKYGVTRDYVMELEAVLPSGDLIRTGVRTHKGVVGYDLTRLLVGSEGTLAIVTKIRLRVLPVPEAVVTLLASFGDVETAGRAVSETIASRIIPRVLEFMDRESIEAVEKFKPTGLSPGMEALLLIEIDGAPQGIEEDAEKVVEVCRSLGAEVEMAADEEARQRLWQCRRALSPALYHLSPTKINEDIVVPRSRLAEMLGSLRRLSEDTGIRIVNFGHAGDGNIHVNIMVDRRDEEQYKKGVGLVREIFGTVLALGGTISGEHGIGLTKADYIEMEIKEKELSLMKGIKRLFDPENMLNPGKVFRGPQGS